MKPVALIILDGWGHREGKEHNAIKEAGTPFFDALWHNYPHTLLNASEQHVGLPSGTIGNSEIGHMTMGAGRVIDTDLVRISKAMNQGEFDTNPTFIELFNHVKKYNSTLHILGLLSSGGVHSHHDHLYGFLKAAKNAGLIKVAIHAFTDGRDVPPKSAAEYLKQLEKLISEIGIGHIATVVGRYFAMDRDKNWDRTQKAVSSVFSGEGLVMTNTLSSSAVKLEYKKGVIDEYIEPLVFPDDQGNTYKIEKNDGIFFFNYRTDRPRQYAKEIAERSKKMNLYFVTLTEYDPTISKHVAFPPLLPETTLAAEISKAGFKQSHIAETEKYAHVTFFFNGGRQTPHENERHFLIDSRKDVATHDLAPEMRAKEIADRAIKCVDEGDDFLVINFANADMVGHTANKPAIVTAVETVDRELKRVVDSIIAKGGIAIITADHGNAEQNVDETTGELHTAHTLNLVPFIVASKESGQWVVDSGQSGKKSLADIAPTVLNLLQIKKPSTMTGQSLLT